MKELKIYTNEEYLKQFKELQIQIQKSELKQNKIWKILDLKSSEEQKYSKTNPYYIQLKEKQKEINWLNKIRTQMLYEKYFADHSKGQKYLSEAKDKDGEYWDDRYYYEIRNILGKWYKKSLKNVNDFYLLYEGVGKGYIDPKLGSGIETSAWSFVGNTIYKIIREIAQPTLYLDENETNYRGILFKDLWEWRIKNQIK